MSGSGNNTPLRPCLGRTDAEGNSWCLGQGRVGGIRRVRGRSVAAEIRVSGSVDNCQEHS